MTGLWAGAVQKCHRNTAHSALSRENDAPNARSATQGRAGAPARLCEGQGYSKPFFFRISSALFLSMSIVGKVMTGSSFPPFSSLTAWRSPSAPGVA